MAPPPEEEKPLPVPRPEPEPKPPKPKPAGPEPPKPKPAGPLPERDGDPGGGVATFPPEFLCADTCSGACVYLPHCQPPPPPSSRGTTLHLRSSRLPTPLIALSASLLAVSAVLLLALLVHRLLAQRRRRRRARNAALALAAAAILALVMPGLGKLWPAELPLGALLPGLPRTLPSAINTNLALGVAMAVACLFLPWWRLQD